ncbi:Fur family transcriptional regulator [Brytella acorum]|uniref:Fur family transcriptional regulator n=1 Tax=Brytella acorum TaxID=2959299 RepID=A0AA35UVD2_9PROT|nr:Fur family transcriptional regulator [Brytella acorum]MDF3625523.1 Fur family transcriptional regulator [Brytella acorum]CAI9120377.1 Fur family transcriptional regulator [Brytella acorum]
MLVFPEHRRSPPDVQKIRPGMEASGRLVRQIERRCRAVGFKMTGVRRVLLHGILEAGEGATAVEIWKTLGMMIEGHVPSHGSLQRNLNLLVEHGVLHRDVGADRIWRYRVAPKDGTMGMAVTFVEADTGREIACDAPEVAILLRRIAARHGLAVREASITVAPSPLHAVEAR